MKTKTELKRGRMTKVVIATVVSTFLGVVLHAQTVSNIKVNTSAYSNVSLDGGAKQISVLNDTVYAVWAGTPTEGNSSIYFAKSINEGSYFIAETFVYQGNGSLYHDMFSISVSDENGDIHIAWTTMTNTGEANVWYTKSVDGGNTFQTPTEITTNNTSVYPCIGTHGNNVYIFYADASSYPKADYYFVSSTNNGDAFATPVKINDATICDGTIPEFEGLATITIAPNGNIYLAWVDCRHADGNGDIYFAKSTDGGDNFSINIMVNDINEQGADSVQFHPAIAVDGSDNIYVSFADLRTGNDDRKAYLAKSTDGGASFATETLLANQCNYHDIAVNSTGKLYAVINAFIAPDWGVWLLESNNDGSSFTNTITLKSPVYSDDVSVVVSDEEEIYALWKDNGAEGDDNNDIYIAKITDLATNIVETNDNNEFIVYTNPASGEVFVKLPENRNSAEMTICNMQGQIIYRKTIVNSITNIDMEIPSGIYFVNVYWNDKIQTSKLVKK